jgi:hypothetical protein
MLARDSKPSVLQPSVLLQQPGQMGPLRLKNRVVMDPMGTNFPMKVRLSATEYADGGYSLDGIVTLSNGKRIGRHHDRIRLRALCHSLCHP